MENSGKKGQLISLGILLVVTILIVIFVSLALIFPKVRYILIGVGFIVGGFIYLVKVSSAGEKLNGYALLITFGLGIILIFGSSFFANVLQTSYTGNNLPSNVKLAVPHNGAYFCTSVGTGNPSYTIPSSGIWINKNTIGVYTDQITSMNIYVPQTFWDSYFKSYLGGGIRADIKVCDANQANCQSDIYQSLTYAGTTTLALPFTSFNPQSKSVYITLQSRYTALSSWQNDATLNSKTQVNLAYTKYGLKYVSTTGNPAGSLFAGCESSCDLTCPEQKSRSDTGLIITSENSLLPTESVPVLEYWESLDVDLNSEMGATIYDGNQFCFGGATYSKAYINLDNGASYIYPNTATRQRVECCNGAAISTSTEDKTCVNNRWVTITKETRIRCTSDFNCPGQGQFTCQNRMKSGYSCGSDGYCNKDSTNIQVQCCSQADCPTDQTCQNNICVGGANLPTCGNGKLESGEQCDDGNTISGDKCSSICTIEIVENETLSCKWYEEPYQSQEKVCKVLWVFLCEQRPKSGCQTSGWIYAVIGGVFVVILFIVTILLLKKPVKKRRK